MMARRTPCLIQMLGSKLAVWREGLHVGVPCCPPWVLGLLESGLWSAHWPAHYSPPVQTLGRLPPPYHVAPGGSQAAPSLTVLCFDWGQSPPCPVPGGSRS